MIILNTMQIIYYYYYYYYYCYYCYTTDRAVREDAAPEARARVGRVAAALLLEGCYNTPRYAILCYTMLYHNAFYTIPYYTMIRCNLQ